MKWNGKIAWVVSGLLVIITLIYMFSSDDFNNLSQLLLLMAWMLLWLPQAIKRNV